MEQKPYKPSTEEIKKAEEMMTPEERGRSDYRSEGFELGQLEAKKQGWKPEVEVVGEKFDYETRKREIDNRFQKRRDELNEVFVQNGLGHSNTYYTKLRQAEKKEKSQEPLSVEDKLLLSLEKKSREITSEKDTELEKLERQKHEEAMKKLNQV